ncbi:30S ribosomal protein S20, partial [Phocaeicola dorei]
MPIIKSAIERVRTSEKAQARNASQMSEMRTAVKKFDKAKVAGAENL